MAAKVKPAGPGFFVRDPADLDAERAAEENSAALVEVQQFLKAKFPDFKPAKQARDVGEVRRGKVQGPQGPPDR